MSSFTDTYSSDQFSLLDNKNKPQDTPVSDPASNAKLPRDPESIDDFEHIQPEQEPVSTDSIKMSQAQPEVPGVLSEKDYLSGDHLVSTSNADDKFQLPAVQELGVDSTTNGTASLLDESVEEMKGSQDQAPLGILEPQPTPKPACDPFFMKESVDLADIPEEQEKPYEIEEELPSAPPKDSPKSSHSPAPLLDAPTQVVPKKQEEVPESVPEIVGGEMKEEEPQKVKEELSDIVPKVTKAALDDAGDLLNLFEAAEPTKMDGDTSRVNGIGSTADDKAEVKEEPSSTVSCCSYLTLLTPSSWFNPDNLPPSVANLVYWRDVKKSGVVFGTGFVVLLSLVYFSLISVLAYLSLALLSVAISFRIYKNIIQAVQKTQDGHPFKEILEMDLTLPSDKLHEFSDVALSYVNCVLQELRRLFLVEDLVDSLKFGVMLWCLTYVGAWFNGLTLVILAFVAIFTLPKVYETNKTQIDQNLDFVRNKFNEVSTKVKSAIPLGKKEKEQ